MIEYLFAIVIFLMIYSIMGQKKDPRLPPGIRGWPIVGSFPSFKVPLVYQVDKFRKQFGDVFSWRIGVQNIVYICDPKIIKTAFNNPHLINRPQNFVTFDARSKMRKIGIINGNGIAWQSHRRFALRHLRDSGLGKSILEDIIHLEAEKLIKDLKDNYLNKPAQISTTFNVATLNVIWKLTSDICFERDDEDLHKFLGSLTRISTQVQGPVNIFDVLPWLLPLTPKFLLDKIGFTELQESRKDVANYLKSVVMKSKASLNKENPFGFIDAYLSEMQSSNPDSSFHDDALLISLMDLFLAGSDTSTSIIRWTIQYMVYYPELQRRVQKEIDSVVPKNRLPSISDKPSLPYTEATIYEALRITSLIPLGIVHAAGEDTMIEQYFIPKGTVIQPFLYGCHMDPKYWEKPTNFYPEHFLDSNGNFTAKNEAFLPFSCGKRVCLGESLARTELFLFISALLQNFSFHAPEGEKLSFERNPKHTIIELPPKIKLIIKERLQ